MWGTIQIPLNISAFFHVWLWAPLRGWICKHSHISTSVCIWRAKLKCEFLRGRGGWYPFVFVCVNSVLFFETEESFFLWLKLNELPNEIKPTEHNSSEQWKVKNTRTVAELLMLTPNDVSIHDKTRKHYQYMNTQQTNINYNAHHTPSSHSSLSPWAPLQDSISLP